MKKERLALKKMRSTKKADFFVDFLEASELIPFGMLIALLGWRGTFRDTRRDSISRCVKGLKDIAGKLICKEKGLEVIFPIYRNNVICASKGGNDEKDFCSAIDFRNAVYRCGLWNGERYLF